jgi:phage terminase large subunit-like protein
MRIRPTNSPGDKTPIAAALTMTRGERVIAFIEKYCKVPEGKLVGQPVVLDPFQKRFILDVYDNPHGTTLAILSIARKNGKTALIAGIALAHICGPEAQLNSQICSGAMSRDQAAIVFKHMVKMIQLNPLLAERVRIVPSGKTLLGLSKNVEFRALAADGATAQGLSPILAILDELGQVRGPQSDFIDAITTAQGAHDNPLIIVISTQAPNDADLLSIWIDDALTSKDPHTIVHLYCGDKDCEIMDEEQWRKANPALGNFRSEADMRKLASKAQRMPSFRPSFRNLNLNQRVDMVAPFIDRDTWLANKDDPLPDAFRYGKVYGGLDLSGKTDLTALVAIAWWEGRLHVRAWFWTPEKGLADRAKRDRAPYDVWVDQGFIKTTPGASVDYGFVARDIAEIFSECEDIQAIGFDRWRIDLLQKEFNREGINLPLVPFGQGFKDMAPAIDRLEELLLNENVSHGEHPVLTMCMANSRVVRDPTDNRKLDKQKATGRIDGAVALTIAVGVLPQEKEDGDSVYEGRGILMI